MEPREVGSGHSSRALKRKLFLCRGRRSSRAATQVHVLVGIHIRRGRRTTFGKVGRLVPSQMRRGGGLLDSGQEMMRTASVTGVCPPSSSSVWCRGLREADRSVLQVHGSQSRRNRWVTRSYDCCMTGKAGSRLAVTPWLWDVLLPGWFERYARSRWAIRRPGRGPCENRVGHLPLLVAQHTHVGVGGARPGASMTAHSPSGRLEGKARPALPHAINHARADCQRLT